MLTGDSLMDIRIETSRLVLRPFMEQDAAAACRNSKSPSVAYYMPEMMKETANDALEWINHVNSELFDVNVPCALFAVVRKLDGQCMGCIFIQRKEKWGNVVEMGYYIADEYQGGGYATEAGKAMVWWAFEEAGQDMLSVFVKPENIASRRVIEKLGFIHDGEKTLLHNGEDCEFDFYRMYHVDDLPSPEWDAGSLYGAEQMGDFFDARAGGYNEHMFSGSGDDDYKKLGASFPKSSEAIKILDIGCGTGIELDYIWGQLPNASIDCVDVSQGMLDLLLKNHPDRHGQINIVKASYIDWAYPGGAYDFVVSNMTMHHLWPDEKLKVYRKILGTLKPGGPYIEGDYIVKDSLLAEQHKRRHGVITAGLAGKAGACKADVCKADAGEYHIDIPCTLDVQLGLLRKAGFCPVEVFDDNINRGNGAIIIAKKPGAGIV